MMLTVFLVDTGTTFTFEIKFALNTVSELKEAIERECGVSESHQVLLMNGGVSLEPTDKVSNFCTGTETNPIFLFSKASIESNIPPQPTVDYGSDVDLTSQVTNLMGMPATYQTVVSRAQLAQHCCSLDRDQMKICERLVYDQHLQQQGWGAVIANLEDITNNFENRAETLVQTFANYLKDRDHHLNILQQFNTDLSTLETIPILPALREHADGFLYEDLQEQQQQQQQQQSLADDNTATQSVNVLDVKRAASDPLSLLRWISAKDNQSSLEQVAEQCSRGLYQFDERILDTLKNDIQTALSEARLEEMKEIKGLCDRLITMEHLLAQVRKILQEQTELAQGFQQNKLRVSNLNDESVLPDLCMSHCKQLELMLKNHNHLRDIRRRCTKAKEELSHNIYRRLKWIMHVENRMMEVDSKMVMYHESLRRLRRQLEILRQIHLAPEMYMSAISEVVRRRAFSQAFLVWASNLACQLLNVHREELERRQEFQSKFEGHFLNSLFPGLEDMPPPFATQAPPVFDNSLPKLSAEDMDTLKQKLPDLANSLSTPDMSSITQLFFSKSISDSNSDGNKEKESSSMRVDPVPKEQETARPPLISDRGDFESETDTDEFEKIGQAAMDCKPTSYESTKQQTPSHQKQMEENLGNTREEVERLRAIIRKMKSVAMDTLLALRHELSVIKEQTLVDQESVVTLIEKISDTVKLHACALREREQEITVDHELELSDLKKMLQTKDDQIHNLERALADKESECAEEEKLITIMKKKLEGEKVEVKKLQGVYKVAEHVLVQLRVEKESAIKESNEAKEEANTLRNSLEQSQDRIRELEEKLASAEVEYQKAIKEESDKLQLEYKDQYETMRSRFKLMHASTMERSPSDSSLEKIERVDVIELSNHESIICQSVEAKRDECKRAIQDERLKMSQTNSELGESMKSEKSDDVKVSESKKVRLENDSDSFSLPTKLERLEADNRRLNSELRATRESKEEMEAKLEALAKEKERLEMELLKERGSKQSVSTESMSASSSPDGSRDKDMNASVAVVASPTNRVDAATSTERSRHETSSSYAVRDKLTKSTIAFPQQGKITYSSCNAGDTVLITWDADHHNYTILQDSQTYYFLNSDCLAVLDLKPGPDGQPLNPYVVAEVVEKEYCSARKAENRYKVPQGTKFFRVRVKPLKRPIKAGKH